MAAAGVRDDGHTESAFRNMSGSFGDASDKSPGHGGDEDDASLVKQTIALVGSNLCSSFPVYGQDVAVIASEASSATTEGSNKVKVTRVVNYDFDMRPHFGRIVAVDSTRTCIAYVLKGKPSGGIVRLINRRLAEKALIKDYTSNVVDIAFSVVNKLMLASVEENGTLHVHSIKESPLVATPLLHLKYTPSGFNALSPSHRVVWCPYVPEESADEQASDPRHLLAVSFDSRVLMVNVGTVRASYGADVPLDSTHLKEGVLEIANHLKSIVDMAFSPDGSALATASADGFVKFFQVYLSNVSTLRCLYEWLPHEGRAVTSLLFLDDHKQPSADVQFWKYAITGADNNRELKVWSCETWKCLQTLRFMPSPKNNIEPHLVAAIDLSARNLVLSDINRKVLYILQLHQDEASNTAHVSGLSEFLLASPCISFDIMDASLSAQAAHTNGTDDDDESEDTFASLGATDRPSGPQGSLHLAAIQPRELNEMLITYRPDLSASLGASLAPSSVGSLHAPTSSFDSSGTPTEPLQPLSLSNASSVSKSVLLTPNSFMLTSPSASSSLTRVTALPESDLTAATASLFPATSPVRTKPESPLTGTEAADLLRSSTGSHAESIGLRNSGAGLVPDDVSESALAAAPSALYSDASEKASTSEPLLGSASTSNVPTDEALLGGSVTPVSGRAASGASRRASDAGSAERVSPALPIFDLSSPRREPAAISPRNEVAVANSRPSTASDQFVIPDSSRLEGSLTTSAAQEDEATPSASDEERSYSDEDAAASALAASAWALAPQLLPSHEDSSTAERHRLSPKQNVDSRPADDSTSAGSVRREPPAVAAESRRSDMGEAGSRIAVDTSDVLRTDLDAVDSTVTGAGSMSPIDMTVKVGEARARDRSLETTGTSAAAFEERSVLSALMRSLEEQNKELRLLREEQQATRNVFQKQILQLDQQLRSLQQHVAASASPVSLLVKSVQRMEASLASKLDAAADVAAQRGRQQQQDISTAVHQSSADAKAVLEKTISVEVKKALAPGLQHLTDVIRKELPTMVADRFTSSEAVFRQQLESLITSKQTTNAIAEGVGSIVQGVAVTAYRDVMQQTVLPSIENSMKKLFQQLNSTFHSGIQEYLKETHTHFDKLQLRQQNAQGLFTTQVEDMCKDIRLAVSEMVESRQRLSAATQQQAANADSQLQRTITSMQSSLLAEIRQLLQDEVRATFAQLQGSLNAQIAGSVVEAVTRAGAATPLPSGAMDFDHYKNQLSVFLAREDINAAFRLALSASDLAKVMYLLKQVDFSLVFGKASCPLQQPVILSLVNQLVQDLENENDFELKYRYLQEGILNLDFNDPVTREHGPRVVGELCAQLSSFIYANSTSSMCKPLKMLHMAAQSLLSRK